MWRQHQKFNWRIQLKLTSHTDFYHSRNSLSLIARGETRSRIENIVLIVCCFIYIQLANVVDEELAIQGAHCSPHRIFGWFLHNISRNSLFPFYKQPLVDRPTDSENGRIKKTMEPFSQ